MPRGFPVRIVEKGGAPVTQVTKNAPVATVSDKTGHPVTLVEKGGAPLMLFNQDGTPYTGVGVPSGYSRTTFNGSPVTYNGSPVFDNGRDFFYRKVA